MYKVLFSRETFEYISDYFEKYREYYEKLYEDSWIWSEKQIVDSYIKESSNRKEEIIGIITTYLKEEKIFWRTRDNTIIISWRTKYIFLDFEENLDLMQRYIVGIWIR